MTEREMTFDESARRGFVEQNTAAVRSEDPIAERARLESIHGTGNVFNTDQVQEKYEIV